MGDGLQGEGEGYTVYPSKPTLGEHKTSQTTSTEHENENEREHA